MVDLVAVFTGKHIDKESLYMLTVEGLFVFVYSGRRVI
jgi:hypothetical protein